MWLVACLAWWRTPIPTQHYQGDSLKAIVITAPGDPTVLELADRPMPVPGRGDVLVRVRACGVNRADLLQRMGRYPAPDGAPADIPGLEIAGEVADLAPGMQAWSVGDRVMGLVGGGYAEFAAVPEEHVVRVPDDWSFEQAAAGPKRASRPSMPWSERSWIGAEPKLRRRRADVVGSHPGTLRTRRGGPSRSALRRERRSGGWR